MKSFKTHVLLSSVLILFMLPIVASSKNTPLSGLKGAVYHQSRATGQLYIQLGSFSKLSNAQHLLKAVQAKKVYSVRIKFVQGYHVVLVGPFHSTADASFANQQLGINPVLRQPVVKRKRVIHPQIIKEKPLALHPWKDQPPPARFSFVSALSVGPLWTNGGRTQTLLLAPGSEKTYTAAHKSQTVVEGELFFGIKAQLPYAFQNQLGLELAATSKAGLPGQIANTASPLVNNYVYDYKLRHSRIALKDTLFIDRGYALLPWVTGSIGLGYNQAGHFTNALITNEAINYPNFISQSTTSLTYTVGAGLQRNLSNHWQIGLGYEFADWGKSKLGKAPGQTVGQGLELNHFYTNGLLVNLTYVC